MKAIYEAIPITIGVTYENHSACGSDRHAVRRPCHGLYDDTGGQSGHDRWFFIAARNEDYSANNAKHMVIHPAAHNQHGVFKSHGNDFTYPLPKEALRYTAIHDFDTGINQWVKPASTPPASE